MSGGRVVTCGGLLLASPSARGADPQLHDYVVVLNRARSVSDGQWRTLDLTAERRTRRPSLSAQLDVRLAGTIRTDDHGDLHELVSNLGTHARVGQESERAKLLVSSPWVPTRVGAG